MRDTKIKQLYEGTSQIQRLVIAKEVLLPRSESQGAAPCSEPPGEVCPAALFLSTGAD
jgi:hypothetical protein